MRIKHLHIATLFALLMMLSCSQKKETNWQVTFDKNSKEPYGCYLSYHLLRNFFPNADIESGRNLFSEVNHSLDKMYAYSSKGRTSFVVCRNFETDSVELNKLIRYVQLGNTVCIVAENFSENMFRYFNLTPSYVDYSESSFFSIYEDTIPDQRTNIFFNHVLYPFTYNGLSIQHGFTIDTAIHEKYYFMGYSTSIDTPNSMIRSVGDGNLVICRNPITLTNHFMLQNDNRKFIECFFSYFSSSTSTVTWYNMYERKARENNEIDLSWLLKFPPLFYAFLILAILLLFYTLFEGKRRQKNIPVIQGNTNSSLEFTETVGMLYYNKKDNKNLSEKMIQHYLENVRSKYSLKTNALNEEFADLLSQKTNHTYTDTQAFIAYIRYIRESYEVTDIDIKHLYHQLQKFI